MKIFIRVDASLEIGTGHVMRCLTLAAVFKDNGADVEFICRKHEGNLIDKICGIGFKVNELKLLDQAKVDSKLTHSHWLNATQRRDAEDCIHILRGKKIDWLIVDHYALDEDWQNHLRPYYEKLMVIDDLADRNHQCDILLDQTFGRQHQDYSALNYNDCQLLLGSQYALLRPEFSKWRVDSLERRSTSDFKHLLVTMGGVDIENFTGLILDELRTSSLPHDVNITVLMGRDSPHLCSVKSKASELPYNTSVKVAVENMAEIMTNADIAIGAAGATTWERCCLGLPTIQIIVARNQQFLAETLARQSIVKLIKKIKEIPYLLKSSSEWMGDCSSLAASICDGMGSHRVFNKMSDRNITLKNFGEVNLCNYINLNQHDKNLALSMRNHQEITKWMLNQNRISEEEHFGFIDDLEIKMEQRYFLVKQKGIVIGSINFSKINNGNSVEFGIFTNVFLQLKGSGKLLESAASQYAFTELNVETLKLKVLAGNARAINFYNKCGFEVTNTKNINHQNIIYMEKKRVAD